MNLSSWYDLDLEPKSWHIRNYDVVTFTGQRKSGKFFQLFWFSPMKMWYLGHMYCGSRDTLSLFLHNHHQHSPDHDRWGIKPHEMLLRHSSSITSLSWKSLKRTFWVFMFIMSRPWHCNVSHCNCDCGKNTLVKGWYLVLKSWLCNKSATFLGKFTN